MYRQFFSALDSPALPLAAMAFFAIAFALVLLRTFAWKRTKDYDSVADLPLADGEATFRKEVKP